MCDPAKCDPKNQCACAPDGKTASCKLQCSAQTDCPFNYFCNDESPSYCQSMTFPGGNPITKKDKGQWGFACNPTGGEANNPDCDSAQGFGCWGKSPTDATAFCTTIGQCRQDPQYSDCPGGWWCETLNAQPNVTTTKAKWGTTRPVCMPRWYCSPCQQDYDCSLSADGLPQHCITDTGGTNKYCATECGQTSNCAPDASCSANNDPGIKLCMPNAGVCVGDGTLCSPCHSDDDCAAASAGGFCLVSDYSHERFCGALDTTNCISGQAPTGCPPLPTGVKAKRVSCTSMASDYLGPKNQCLGIVTLQHGASAQAGCWVPNQ
jgi:hypothetical protein